MRALSDGIAGCGKSASPVWRGGRGKSMPRPYPISPSDRTVLPGVAPSRCRGASGVETRTGFTWGCRAGCPRG